MEISLSHVIPFWGVEIHIRQEALHQIPGHFDIFGPKRKQLYQSQLSQRRQRRRLQIFDQSLWMVSEYLQKAQCQVSSQTNNVWPSINSQGAKSSLSAGRTTEAIAYQTKYMGGFNMLPKCYSLSFRSFRQHLTILWRSEAKLGLLAAKLLGTMTSKSELINRLKMTPIGSPSNFKSIGHRLTVHLSAASSSRQN